MAARESWDVEYSGRETLSRRLLLEARKPKRFELDAPHSHMGASLLDDVGVTHYGGYGAGGAGWGSRVHERQHAEIEGIGWDPGAKRFWFGLRDARGALLRTVWLPGSITRQYNRLQYGEALVYPSTRYWWRPTVAYLADPETGALVQVYFQTPKLTDKGFLIERMRTNIVKASAFNSGYAGWAATGTGAITDDVGTRLFAADPPDGIALEPGQTKKFVSGNPHTNDLYLSQTVATGVVANTKRYALSFHHFDDSQVAAAYQVLLSGNYYNAITPGWQAGAVWNALPISPLNAWRRDVVVFTANATADPEIRIGLPNTVGVDKTMHLAHVQLDVGRTNASHPWPGSHVITPSGASGYGEGDVFYIDNGSSCRVWPASQGTALLTITTLWSSADVLTFGFTFTVFRVKYDANNEVWLFYDGDNQRFTFRRKSGGATTDLNSGTVAIVAGTPVTVELRWTSAYGELVDLYGAPAGGNRWFDMIVNGTRVPGAQSVQPVETAASLLCLGGEEGNQLDGYLKTQITPYVLTEAECAKWRLAA